MATVIVMLWVLMKLQAPFWCYVLMIVGYALQVTINAITKKD